MPDEIELPKNEFDILQDRMQASEVNRRILGANPASEMRKVASVDGSTLLSSMTKNQWAVLPNDSFTAIGTTVSHLPPAIYTLSSDGGAIFFHKTKVLTDNLIDLDDSAALRIIAGIEKFWESKSKFDRFGILFKRGILMWGPAGSGKTAAVNMLMNDLVGRGGMVVIVQSPGLAIGGLHELRRIEPERPIIVVLEDIEEMIQNFGEHGLLSLLDGEHQVSNVVVLATTNYPELLGERIINRPSRFDEVILVDMPSFQECTISVSQAHIKRHGTRSRTPAVGYSNRQAIHRPFTRAYCCYSMLGSPICRSCRSFEAYENSPE
jgi:hypothetical protein